MKAIGNAQESTFGSAIGLDTTSHAYVEPKSAAKIIKVASPCKDGKLMFTRADSVENL